VSARVLYPPSTGSITVLLSPRKLLALSFHCSGGWPGVNAYKALKAYPKSVFWGTLALLLLPMGGNWGTKTRAQTWGGPSTLKRSHFQ